MLQIDHLFKWNPSLQAGQACLPLIRHIKHLKVQLAGHPDIIFHNLHILNRQRSLAKYDSLHIAFRVRYIIIVINVELVRDGLASPVSLHLLCYIFHICASYLNTTCLSVYSIFITT